MQVTSDAEVCILMVSVCNTLGLAMRALLVSTLRLFAYFLPFLWVGFPNGIEHERPAAYQRRQPSRHRRGQSFQACHYQDGQQLYAMSL
jgi:uncharacterized membrane protein